MCGLDQITSLPRTCSLICSGGLLWGCCEDEVIYAQNAEGSARHAVGAQNFLASFPPIMALTLFLCLPTGHCGDDRHSEPSGLLGKQLLSPPGAGTSRELAESSGQTSFCSFRTSHTPTPFLLVVGPRQCLQAQIVE